MELFAEATGCSDPKIACLFLERAGNDVARAVNHFFDSPPPKAPPSQQRLNPSRSSTSTSSGSSYSNRAPKRQRAGEAHQQQELLSFQRARPPQENCKPPYLDLEQDALFKKAGAGFGIGQGNVGFDHAAPVQASPTKTTTIRSNSININSINIINRSIPQSARAARESSAEWTRVAARCQRCERKYHLARRAHAKHFR